MIHKLRAAFLVTWLLSAAICLAQSSSDDTDSYECPLAKCSSDAPRNVDTQLWTAVHDSDPAKTKAALAAGANPNACSGSYERPLHVAASEHHPEQVRLLLQAGASPNVMNCPGNTPLILAVAQDDVSTEKLLLSGHADPNAGNNISPLQMAASHGYVASVTLLLSKGADPNRQYGPFSTTALMEAARSRQVEVVEHLLQAGANPNLHTGSGETALFDAVGGFQVVPPSMEEQDKALRMVTLLVGHGAHVNDAVGASTPLVRAKALKEARIAEALIQAGAK